MVVNELIRFTLSAGKENSERDRALSEQTLKIDPLAPLTRAQASWRYFVAGRWPEAIAAAHQVLELTTVGWTEYLALFLADGYALIDQRDKALYWLRAAVERAFINYPFLAEHDPYLKLLMNDTEFAALLGQVRRRWQALTF